MIMITPIKIIVKNDLHYREKIIIKNIKLDKSFVKLVLLS